jgi:phage portal protein BeeE
VGLARLIRSRQGVAPGLIMPPRNSSEIRKLWEQAEARSGTGLSFPDYLRLWERFGFNGVEYMIPSGQVGEIIARESIRDPIVMACMTIRIQIFSEVTFAFQAYSAGRPGELSDSPRLQLLREPWPEASTGDLLARMEMDGQMYGNSYWVTSTEQPNTLTRLEPARVKILTGDVSDNLTDKAYGQFLVGYAVYDRKQDTVSTFGPDEVVHYRPLPDPEHPYRGMSWLHSLLPDVMSDLALTDYKNAFLTNAATPNLVVSFTDPIGEDAFLAFKNRLDDRHSGAQAGFKTLYVGSGVDVKTIGSNLQELDLANILEQGEMRICAAAGVPAPIVGVAGGMKGSALNANTYTATRRRLADATIRPLWRAAANSLSVLVPAPPGKRLWYDDRDVAFLQADLLDAAQVRAADATTMLTLINSGYTPESVTLAIETDDWSVLEHSQLISVQLQAMTYDKAEDAAAASIKAALAPKPPPLMIGGPPAASSEDSDSGSNQDEDSGGNGEQDNGSGQ